VGRTREDTGKGQVFTPFRIALHMVSKLFKDSPPDPSSRVLDAGCGTGVFVEALIHYLSTNKLELPKIVCIEIDDRLIEVVRKKFEKYPQVRVIHGDFLLISEEELGGKFDYIISNPPYVSYEYIEDKRRESYRKFFNVAKGRFDTYMLFFEKALQLLKHGGRLVFITPEKYIYTLSARELRKLLAKYTVEELEFIDEEIFPGVLAYPLIIVIRKIPREGLTTVKMRDGTIVEALLPTDGSSWLSALRSVKRDKSTISGATCIYLKSLAIRISAGVATGRDEVFVMSRGLLPKELEPYAYPTISGRELSMFKPGDVIDYKRLKYVMLVPYDIRGNLLSEDEARPLISYLSKYKKLLEERYIVKSGKKKWYAFHEDPPLEDILKPKILWRDIDYEPSFYIDEKGLIIPRHSVYYLVPKDPSTLRSLAMYLNSEDAKSWLRSTCQRAANNYIRLQSHIIKELCVPKEVIEQVHHR
jgi:tRNA1(Val) A37 N6-methylase TrmN6